MAGDGFKRGTASLTASARRLRAFLDRTNPRGGEEDWKPRLLAVVTITVAALGVLWLFSRAADTATIHATIVDDAVAELDVDGLVVDGRLQVDAGTLVFVRVTSERNDKVIVDTYSPEGDGATTGIDAGLSFVADQPGVFPVRMQNAGITIIEIQVR